MNPCRNTQKTLFEVWCTASGEQDYTHKQAAGQSCLSGQWTNWIICEHLRVMGWSAGSDPLACVFLSCLTACNESNRLWRWCAQSGFSDVGESIADGTQRSRAGEGTGSLSIWQGQTCRGKKNQKTTTTENTGKCSFVKWQSRTYAVRKLQTGARHSSLTLQSR